VPKETRRLDTASEKIEQRLVRSFLKAVDKMREDVSISEIAQLISTRDIRHADRALPSVTVEDRLQPSSRIVSDAVEVGGKLGAEEING